MNYRLLYKNTGLSSVTIDAKEQQRPNVTIYMWVYDSKRIRFCWRTDVFLSSLAHHPHVTGENGHRKRTLTKTLSRVEFFKMPASSLRVDKRKGEFSNTMMSSIIYF